jgi:excisionase family DNA binding protein
MSSTINTYDIVCASEENGELPFPVDARDEPVFERHYKTRELAEMLGLHLETIRRAAQRGELESVRVGLDRIYAESAVNNWLEANRDRSSAAERLNGNTPASTKRREAR